MSKQIPDSSAFRIGRGCQEVKRIGSPYVHLVCIAMHSVANGNNSADIRPDRVAKPRLLVNSRRKKKFWYRTLGKMKIVGTAFPIALMMQRTIHPALPVSFDPLASLPALP